MAEIDVIVVEPRTTATDHDREVVTARRPNDTLYYALQARLEAGDAPAIKSLTKISDCDAPALIAAAVFAGHRYARELDIAAEGKPLIRR